MIGCERVMIERAETPETAERVRNALRKAERYYSAMGHGSFAPGNAEGGLIPGKPGIAGRPAE